MYPPLRRNRSIKKKAGKENEQCLNKVIKMRRIKTQGRKPKKTEHEQNNNGVIKLEHNSIDLIDRFLLGQLNQAFSVRTANYI